jgi:hypothetical protein
MTPHGKHPLPHPYTIKPRQTVPVTSEEPSASVSMLRYRYLPTATHQHCTLHCMEDPLLMYRVAISRALRASRAMPR